MPIKKILEEPLLMNKLIFESMTDGVWTVNANDECTFINGAALKMLGYTLDQCIGKDMHKLVHYKGCSSEGYPDQECPICQVLFTREASVAEDEAFWKSDGSLMQVRYTVNPVINEDELVGAVVLFSDISELKQKEAEINKLKNNQDSIINATNDLIWSVDTSYRLISFNRAYANRVSNSTRKPVAVGDPATPTVFAPEIVAEWEGYYGRALRGQKFDEIVESYNPEFNEMKFTHNTFVPMRDGQDAIYGVACFSKDLTEEVKARKSIADAYHELQSIFNQSVDVICTFDEMSCFVNVSPACSKAWGYSPEELIGTSYKKLIHPEDLTGATTAREVIVNGIELTHIENRYIHKDGHIVPMVWSAKWDARMNVTYAIGRDNTEKKIAEEKLAQNTEFLKKAQQFAKMGSWKSDSKAEKLVCSEELYNVFGTSQEKFHETRGAFLDMIDERDKQDVMQAINHSRETGELFFVQYRITTDAGEERVLESAGRAEKDSSGDVIALFGTTQNITERKKAEQEIAEANQRFELVIKATFDAIWDWDIVENTLFWGDGFESIFGHPVHGLQKGRRTWSDHIHPDDYETVMQNIDALINGTAGNYLEEYRFQKMDGAYAYVLCKSIIIRDENGKAIRLVGAIQDITKRKEEEHRLKLMESVITNTNDIVLITEAEPFDEPGQRIIFVNEAFTKMTGYTAEEVIGKTPRILQGPNSDRAALNNLKVKMKNWESCEVTTINYKKNGEEFWNNFSVSPVADEKGWFTHWIAIERDITAAKNTEIQLKLLNENLQKQANELAMSNAELEQFAFVASHDLQEPLRMVTSFLTQLERKYGDIIDDKGKKYIYFAVDGAKRMRQIILDLLEYSRVRKISADTDEVDLNVLVEDVRLLCFKKIEESCAVINFRELPTILADKVLLRQIFQNLITNALKYQIEGAVPEITISSHEGDRQGYWLFSVTDNGIGIEEEYFEHIFIIFKRLHSSGEYAGTGMGLAITKRIIENLGGEIWLTSEKGKGSTFYFTIKKHHEL